MPASVRAERGDCGPFCNRQRGRFWHCRIADVNAAARTRTPEVMTRTRRFIETRLRVSCGSWGRHFLRRGVHPIRMRPVLLPMKTIEITPKAPAASKASTKAPFEVRKFTIAERWVEITAKILAEDAEALGGDPSKVAGGMFDSYASSLFIAVDAFNRTGRRGSTWFDIRMDGNRWHRGAMRFKKRVEIRFSVKGWKWLAFVRDCQTIESNPDELIAAAIGSRAQGLEMPGHRERSAR